MNTDKSKALTIGELAKLTAVNIETVRFYQRRGLMTEPLRPSGGIRRYNDNDAARISFIKSAQKLGFSLDEIIILLTLEDGTDCDAASLIAEKKLLEVRKKMDDLRRIEKTLNGLIGQCREQNGNVCCPLISSLQSRRQNDNA